VDPYQDSIFFSILFVNMDTWFVIIKKGEIVELVYSVLMATNPSVKCFKVMLLQTKFSKQAYTVVFNMRFNLFAECENKS